MGIPCLLLSEFPTPFFSLSPPTTDRDIPVPDGGGRCWEGGKRKSLDFSYFPSFRAEGLFLFCILPSSPYSARQSSALGRGSPEVPRPTFTTLPLISSLLPLFLVGGGGREGMGWIGGSISPPISSSLLILGDSSSSTDILSTGLGDTTFIGSKKRNFCDSSLSNVS